MSFACSSLSTDRVGGEDRRQIAVGEPLIGGGVTERPVNACDTVQSGQGDRFGHLDFDPCGASGGGFDEPQPGAFTQRQELGLGWVGSFVTAQEQHNYEHAIALRRQQGPEREGPALSVGM